MDSNVFFIGDVHGCFDELRELTLLLNLKKNDEVILLGDMINRGPLAADVLKFVYYNNYKCVTGNHEADYQKNHLTDNRYINLRRQITDEIHNWIMKLPVFIDTDEFTAVHAGLEPGVPPSASKPEILYTIRTWDGKGNNLKDPSNPPWYDFYTSEKPVFYGHWAKLGLNLRKNTFGLDSGCVYGNMLTAMELRSKKITQLKAGRIYQPTGLLY
jgi:serine/threonine protein phosphatase 1